MKITTDFPYSITENRDMAVMLPDGTRLSAHVWMPENVGPLPAILEYLPYRKSDGTAHRDKPMHAYFAGHGYVCLRVDRRGCGDSEGLFDDEYSEQELSDGVDIIHWIAKQPWCDGNVGIQGISWGGFNGLQIAARAPEPLKAVITIGSTVDRYADDIHYKGGIQVSENVGWAATSMSWFSTPPDPALVGEKWRDMWLERLEATPFLGSRWMEHRDRDAYWKHGSVCEDYSAIKAAVLALGGQLDGYRNTMSHLAANLEAPVKGILGPWTHKYPHISTVQPSIGYMQEALRWWDHWLKGIDTGVENDPAYRAYVMDSIAPSVSCDHRPGEWVSESVWPSPNVIEKALPFGDGAMGQAGEFTSNLSFDMNCGQACGEYFPFGFGPGELPDDQTKDDALSLCFDGPVLDEDQVILGAPKVALTVSADAPKAQIAVRLCDVRPDGTSALISLGFLNLRHRNGFEAGEDLKPGEAYDVTVVLDQAAYRIPVGHRVRVSVSSSYWPYIWPEEQPFELQITGGDLKLPIKIRGDQGWEFEPPEMGPLRDIQQLRKGDESKSWETNSETGETVLTIYGDHGRNEDLENGLITESAVKEVWRFVGNDPGSARAEISWSRSLGREDWEVRTNVQTEMWSEAGHFVLRQVLSAFEGDKQVFEKVFEKRIARG
ncbi:CocE/NonD family hydrolase [Cochlodiniinecator piscidefendens]|uniref:CocE/NonD family hydrolase n=1 Tax=Cochlodiniinecator piscidefendens TaxID=2715756 RepID=UPI0014075CA9|nr:CocE/NonD family hydrolase [Cochlodiniinecator piscidefendens]